METTTEIDQAERASLRVTARQHALRYLRTGGLVLALVGIGAYFTASSRTS